MSVPPSKLLAKLKAMSAARDATDIGPTHVDSVEATPLPPDPFAVEQARRAEILQGRQVAETAARTGPTGQLESDLAQADKNLAKPIPDATDAAIGAMMNDTRSGDGAGASSRLMDFSRQSTIDAANKKLTGNTNRKGK